MTKSIVEYLVPKWPSLKDLGWVKTKTGLIVSKFKLSEAFLLAANRKGNIATVARNRCSMVIYLRAHPAGRFINIQLGAKMFKFKEVSRAPTSDGLFFYQCRKFPAVAIEEILGKKAMFNNPRELIEQLCLLPELLAGADDIQKFITHLVEKDMLSFPKWYQNVPVGGRLPLQASSFMGEDGRAKIGADSYLEVALKDNGKVEAVFIR